MQKSFLILLLLALPHLGISQECENLAGTYIAQVPSDYEPFKLIITQDKCESAVLTRDFYEVPMQYPNTVVFDGQFYDEDMFGYLFNRKYFWENTKAFYEGTLLDSSANFQANIKGELRLTNEGLYNIIEYFDQNDNFITRDVEIYIRESQAHSQTKPAL